MPKQPSGSRLKPVDEKELPDLIDELDSIVTEMKQMGRAAKPEEFGAREESARNLLYYLALRRHDERHLQERLEALGLSSLGRSEGHVLYNFEAVLGILRRMAGKAPDASPSSQLTPTRGREILQKNADALLGPVREGRRVRIMVTMPPEAATDYALVRDLVASGMECMRINCAHDTEEDWSGMVKNLLRAEKELGRKCTILMDIAGPKIRTGELVPGPQVVRLRPKRDEFGRVVAPARIWLTPREAPSAPKGEADIALRFPRSWLDELKPGVKVHFEDTRGSKRTIRVTKKDSDGLWAEARKTAYLSPRTLLHAEVDGRKLSVRAEGIPHREEPIILSVGDRLILTGDGKPGRPAVRDRAGRVVKPALISCTLPHALGQVKVGEGVWLDDGKAGGVTRRVLKGSIEIEITSGAREGTKLGADKGINLPDTELKLPALTDKDVQDLKFISRNADAVGYSFVRETADVQALREQLRSLGREDLGVVLKIETKRAFQQLPLLLLAALRCEKSGVMIARGDLAVECGYERLAEVQEEILWLCEAAHMPAIWATQVLEGLAKSGFPSRAEVTDAAMGERAECVMLNKGPYVVEAVKALDNILRRMQDHLLKKSSMLRHLSVADIFVEGD